MNDLEFKKLDDWMMEAAKRERETRVPTKELEAFHDNVMKKIMERPHPGFGVPYAGMAVAAALSLAVILGAVLYIRMVPAEKENPKFEIRNSRQILNPNIEKPNVSDSDHSDLPIVSDFGFRISNFKNIPPLTESEIVDEVEALKELGVWTEEDEEEAGIPVEVTFADLEVGMDNTQPAVTIASAL